MKTFLQKKVVKGLLGAWVLVFPVYANAQGPDLSYVQNGLYAVGDLVTQLIPLAIAIGLLFFIWGLVQFIIASGDEGAKDEGKRRMVWGIFTLFVMVSVWGLVDILAEMVGIDVGGDIDTPTVNL